VTPEDDPGRPVRATRARRSARRRRIRDLVAAGVVVLVIAASWLLLRPVSQPSSASPPPPSGSGDASGAPALLAFSVTGGAAPDMAVLGTDAAGGRPAAFPIPPDLTIVVPGAGEMSAADVARSPGETMRVALSNELGVWASEYLVTSVPKLANALQRAGGLSVNLPDVYATSAGVLGPGDVTLTGPQLSALLRTKGTDGAAIWDAVLTGLLAVPPAFERRDIVATSSLDAAQAVLDASQGAETLPMPVHVVAGTASVADQPTLDRLVGTTWGTPRPLPVIVQNGSGAPGVGTQVGSDVIPAGFRVALSQNAQSFDVTTTTIIANGAHNIPQARRVRQALGVGRVQVSQVPSGIGNVTIVVGKDFTA
jgi:LytR cell envelope-related transcriptional attenuator